jgi:hypothetical protein
MIYDCQQLLLLCQGGRAVNSVRYVKLSLNSQPTLVDFIHHPERTMGEILKGNQVQDGCH